MTPMSAIQASPLTQALRSSHLLFGTVATVHLIGVGVLFGSVFIMDLRLLGFSRDISVKKMTSHIAPWSLISFVLIVPSGLLMFLARAPGLVGSNLFLLKMTLVMLGGVNAAIYYTGAFGKAAEWDTGQMPPPAARIAAGLSLLIWTTVLTCGSLLAATVT